RERKLLISPDRGFSATHRGPNVAAILSVIESYRRLGVPAKDYLPAILPGLDDRRWPRWLRSHVPAGQRPVTNPWIGRTLAYQSGPSRLSIELTIIRRRGWLDSARGCTRFHARFPNVVAV